MIVLCENCESLCSDGEKFCSPKCAREYAERIKDYPRADGETINERIAEAKRKRRQRAKK